VFLTTKAQRHEGFVQRTISFEENHGQAAPEARFLARGQGYNLVLTPEGNRLVLRHAGRGLSLETQLVGANTNATIRGEEKQAGKVHYLRGDASLTNIPTFAQVRYERVYPGIDLVYYGNQRQLEYDFVVSPGADPGRIALRFEGTDDISVDSQGNLVLRANNSEIVQHKPVVYQKLRGSRKEIQGQYRLAAVNTVSFEVGPYDHSATLIIDPVLSYSTFLGGSNGDDDARAVATDSSGNVYVTGSTTSTNFQTLGPVQATAGSQDPEAGLSDAFVTKLNAAGTALIYSTYLGGTSDDDSNTIAVDSSGSAIIAGSTGSTDFPTTAGAIRRTCNMASSGSCFDAFVAKLNAAGSALVFSTYLGGTSDDEARGIAIDSSGNAYVTGKSASTNFPTTSGAFSTDASSGGFVTKLSAIGAIVYSTYLGAGTGTTEPKGIAVDSSGSAYITGATPSSTTTGTDVFITKLNAAGTAAVYSQVIRGAKDDIGNAVAVDGSGNAYVAGQTASINFQTTAGVLQPAFGGGPAFRSSDAGTNWSATASGINRTSLYALAAAGSALYAGADDEISGGIFKSTDGGANWTSVSTGISDARVHALAVDPATPSTVYAGSRTLGIFKSTNGGATWTATSVNNVFVTALEIDPNTPTTIYAGTDSNGIYKSTNGGSTWTPINNGLVTSAVHSIAINPTASATLYAATGAGIYKSIDGGANWTSANSGLFDPNVNVLAIDPRNPNLIFAGTNSVGVFRSLNAGTFWLASNGGLVSSSLGILVSAMTIDPATGTLYAAIGESNSSRVYKSSNGIQWTATSLSTARLTALEVDRTNLNAVYAATVGGSDAFVAKWNPSGTLVYSTYLGGHRDDAANAIAVDSTGNVYVAGNTSSTNFPVVSAVQTTFGGGSDVVTDAFVAKLNASATATAYATYLGGSNNDFGKGIAIDSNGNAFVVGGTGSADFPTASAITATRPGLLDAFVAKIGDSSTLPYSVSARGGVSTTSQGGASTIAVGYARIQPSSGGTTPAGMAIFGFRQNNVLVSEAAVPASPLMSSGRFYAEVGTTVNTGVAIANPNGSPVTLSFYFTDRNGQNFGSGSTIIGVNSQIAAFLNQTPFNGGAAVFGSFTFTASAPVSVIALRGLTNERFEFLITALPVADLSAAAGTDTILFPHFADGGGWTTQILLVNTTDATMAGSIQFASAPSQDYSIPNRSAVRVATSGIGSAIVTGSVRVAPAAGNKTPSGVAVFSFRNAGVTVTEAGVPALRISNAFRLYAESSGVAGQVGSIQTGVAVANPSSSAATVTFELNTLVGASTGLTGTASVPANGQTALFLNQIQGLGGVPNPFQGVLRVATSSSAGISVVGLRGRYNERGDFLITTTQPSTESTPASTTEQFFPHFADGGGYTTQFILFNGATDQSSAGSLRFFTQSGQTFSLAVR
jgi:hypothetical protein